MMTQKVRQGQSENGSLWPGTLQDIIFQDPIPARNTWNLTIAYPDYSAVHPVSDDVTIEQAFQTSKLSMLSIKTVWRVENAAVLVDSSFLNEGIGSTPFDLRVP